MGLSCISAADTDSSNDYTNYSLGLNVIGLNDTLSMPEIISENDSGVILDDNNDFTMSARYNAGTGYCWVVSPDSYGVELLSTENVVDHPCCAGSSATAYFNFHVTGEDYYVKLILISPSGDIVREIDSNMIN